LGVWPANEWKASFLVSRATPGSQRGGGKRITNCGSWLRTRPSEEAGYQSKERGKRFGFLSSYRALPNIKKTSVLRIKNHNSAVGNINAGERKDQKARSRKEGRETNCNRIPVIATRLKLVFQKKGGEKEEIAVCRIVLETESRLDARQKKEEEPLGGILRETKKPSSVNCKILRRYISHRLQGKKKTSRNYRPIPD